LARGEPSWGIYYKRDTFPGTYAMDYSAAIEELRTHGDDVSLMVGFDGDWKEFVEYD
jgi:exo-beta-1,3-glucanase (GH17 family)